MPCWLCTTGSPGLTSARSRTMPSALVRARVPAPRLAHLAGIDLGLGDHREPLGGQHEACGERAIGHGDRMGGLAEARPVVHQDRVEVVLAEELRERLAAPR